VSYCELVVDNGTRGGLDDGNSIVHKFLPFLTAARIRIRRKRRRRRRKNDRALVW